jgi:hypothetical protein
MNLLRKTLAGKTENIKFQLSAMLVWDVEPHEKEINKCSRVLRWRQPKVVGSTRRTRG